jgi:multidrug efflux pump subunit AcrA (membrane-fusion protein)
MRVKDASQEQLRRLAGPGYFKRKLVLGVAAVALVFFSLATGDYRVTAPATLEGAVRRTLAAPFDGYIASAPARAGDVVRVDAVLATLDDRDLRLERMKWASQYAQYLKQHQEAVANRDRAKAQIVQSLYEQAAAQVNLIDEHLTRAEVKAPFDGVIVKGDLSQSMGAGVKRGDVLFEITPLQSYRVIVEVDEREIADVAQGQKGTLILASIADQAFAFTVASVTSVTTAREGRNYFRVEAMLEQAGDRLRPGMEGVGKIDIERRRLIWIWTHRLVDWFRLFAWTHLP